MTSRRSIPYPDLQTEIEARMQPVSRKRPSLAMQALWGWLAFLTGIGVLLAAIVVVVIVPVVWAVRKAWRAVK